MNIPNPIQLAKSILLDLQANIYQASDDQLREIVRLKRELEVLDAQSDNHT